VVLNGEKETGVTTMLTDVGMDTGDILLCEKIEIGENMTTGEVHDAMSALGAKLIIKTLKGLEKGEITPVPQDHSRATYAPMVDREDGRIDWSTGKNKVHNTVRGCDPFPGAFSFIDGEKVKIWKTVICNDGAFAENGGGKAAGTVLSAGSDGIIVSTGDGAVKILELQRESSKRMAVSAFLNGRKIEPGSVFADEN
jgi:methionyl-tRNA formyltransferase